jgi:hypothetical protein
MQKPRKQSGGSSRRPTVGMSLGIIGLMTTGLLALWWTAAMKTAPLAIPNPVLPNPNAFDFYVAAGSAITNDNQVGNAASTKPPTPFSLAQKEALVQQNAGVITTLHQGFAYPYLNPPCRSNTTLLPYFARYRSLARLLLLRGNVQAEKGDWAGAFDSYLDVLRLGEDVPHGSILLGAMVGRACRGMGRRPMWEGVAHLDAAQSKSAATRLAGIMERHFAYADTLQEEKWFGQACRLEVFNDPQQLKALFTPNGAAGSPGAARSASLSNLLYFVYSKNRIMHSFTTYMDRYIDNARLPYAAHPATPTAPADPVNTAMSLNYARFRMEDVNSETQNGLLLVTLALQAFRLEHGRYPASLAELAPVYLKRLPDDLFALHGTFGYRIQGEGYVLYSVGPDAKDDGGTRIDDVSKARSNNPNLRYFVDETSVGDIVAGKNRW